MAVGKVCAENPGGTFYAALLSSDNEAAVMTGRLQDRQAGSHSEKYQPDFRKLFRP
jgi:hypothetical protein